MSRIRFFDVGTSSVLFHSRSVNFSRPSSSLLCACVLVAGLVDTSAAWAQDWQRGLQCAAKKLEADIALSQKDYVRVGRLITDMKALGCAVADVEKLQRSVPKEAVHATPAESKSAASQGADLSEAKRITIVFDDDTATRSGRLKLTFDPAKITEKQVRAAATVSPYVDGISVETLEQCSDREPGYAPCGTRDISAENFFINAEKNLARGREGALPKLRLALEAPTELKPAAEFSDDK